MAAREMGGLSLADALLLCELLAKADPARYERAALRWLERFINERLPPLTEVALAASALAELRRAASIFIAHSRPPQRFGLSFGLARLSHCRSLATGFSGAQTSERAGLLGAHCVRLLSWAGISMAK